MYRMILSIDRFVAREENWTQQCLTQAFTENKCEDLDSAQDLASTISGIYTICAKCTSRYARNTKVGSHYPYTITLCLYTALQYKINYDPNS